MAAAKVIWADDSEKVRSGLVALARSLCERQGISAEFYEVSTGDELVAAVLSGNYDLVFTDNSMPPGLSGLNAIRQIRRANCAVPAYLVSGLGVDEDVVRLCASAIGASGVIDKNKYAALPASIEGALREHLRKF